METEAYKKIKSTSELARIVATLKQKGKKVVHCHGVFDIVHLGHIRHFNMAKKEGDVLLTTVTRDKHVKRGPGRPVFNEHLRAEALASLAVTDYVSVIDAPTATEFIKSVKPSVYVKGPDYKARKKDVTGKIYEEEDAIKSVGGRLAFTDGITFSSTEIINNHIDVFPPRTVKYLKAISKRYSIDQIMDSLNALKKLNVLVIGDAIIDEYHYCTPMGKSSKEHLVVNRYESKEMFAGGALATANNVGNICGNVDLLTVLGEMNSHKKFIEKRLGKNLNPLFFSRADAGTIVKRRFVSAHKKQKLFEICYMKDSDIPKQEEESILRHLKKTIKNYDLVVVSDFGHGLMTKRIITLICSKARYMGLNVQTNSANLGFNLVTKYPRANCVCIDEMELRFAAHDKSNDIRGLTKRMYQKFDCDHIIATRGLFGSLSYSEQGGFHETPAFSFHVVDAIGAGDAFFAYVAPCYAAGLPQDMISFIGNAVGSLAVQIVCNREPVSYVDLTKFITRLLR